MRVGVFGLGYVGCVTGAWLARAGHEVVGVDVNVEKVALLNQASSPIVEPGLSDLLAAMVRKGLFTATSSAEDAVARSDLALICVGTPGGPNGRVDLRAVEQVGGEIGRALGGSPKPYTVVLRSSVIPGTTQGMLGPALGKAAGPRAAAEVRVAVNPEFMRKGSGLHDFATPPFTLVGCDQPRTASLLRSLYAEVPAPFVCTSVRTAEMVKYVANAFHALKVCFVNEVADVATALGTDAREVVRIFRMDRKLNISDAYLEPGFAFGGSCLPKDLRALLAAARAADLAPPMLSAILPSNAAQVRRGIEAVLETGKLRVGVVGLAFKPGTDDLRESPIVALVKGLIGKGCDVRIFDPHVALPRLLGVNRRSIEHEIPQIASLMCATLQRVLEHAEVLVIASASEAARQALAGAGPHHLVVDLTRGAVQPAPAPRPICPRST